MEREITTSERAVAEVHLAIRYLGVPLDTTLSAVKLPVAAVVETLKLLPVINVPLADVPSGLRYNDTAPEPKAEIISTEVRVQEKLKYPIL
jgi:hypothetical protein